MKYPSDQSDSTKVPEEGEIAVNPEWVDATPLVEGLILEMKSLRDVLVAVAHKLQELLEAPKSRKVRPSVTVYLEARRTARRRRRKKE